MRPFISQRRKKGEEEEEEKEEEEEEGVNLLEMLCVNTFCDRSSVSLCDKGILRIHSEYNLNQCQKPVVSLSSKDFYYHNRVTNILVLHSL